MLLVIDVGNTHTVIGIYKDKNLIGHWRISTDLKKTEDELAMLFINLLNQKGLSYNNIKAIAISCVVPSLTWTLNKMAKNYFQVRPILVNTDLKLNINIKTDYPQELGADRIVNAVAVSSLYSLPAIIIDFGTATTFCALDKDKNYIGGAIAPGLYLSGEALFKRTAKLPEVELTKPAQAIGKNTIHSIQSGVYLGHIGLAKEIVLLFKQELDGEPLVIATGGLAELFAKSCTVISIVDPFLTLKGLQIIHQLNSQ